MPHRCSLRVVGSAMGQCRHLVAKWKSLGWYWMCSNGYTCAHFYIVARRRSKKMTTADAIVTMFVPDKTLILVLLVTSLCSLDTGESMVWFVPVLSKRPLRTGVVMVKLTIDITHVGKTDWILVKYAVIQGGLQCLLTNCQPFFFPFLKRRRVYSSPSWDSLTHLLIKTSTWKLNKVLQV